MPRYSKRKYAPRRKMIRRRRLGGRRRRQVNVNRALQPIPQRYICKMKYSDIQLSSLGGLTYFNINSIFDPNRTGIGHQPYAFDTLATLYNRYRVISCGWRVHVVEGYSDAPTTIACLPANEVLSPSTMSEVRENPRAKYVVAQPGGGTVYCSGKAYLPSLMGRTKAQYMADDRYQAQVTADPQELAILNIATASGADLLAQRTINILLEYTVEFFDVKNVLQS